MNGRARADGTDTYGSVILGDSGAKKMDSQNQHEDDRTPITVGFVGNPNCGKTTLFNAFTGAKLKVANWPGVTVERVEGETSYKGRPIKVIDLPGIYSLTSYTIEERSPANVLRTAAWMSSSMWWMRPAWRGTCILPCSSLSLRSR